MGVGAGGVHTRDAKLKLQNQGADVPRVHCIAGVVRACANGLEMLRLLPFIA